MNKPSDKVRIDQAILRIENALARIEAAGDGDHPIVTADNTDGETIDYHAMARAHDALKKSVGENLRELDAIIAQLEE